VLGSVVTDVYAGGVSDATEGLPTQAQHAAEDSIAFVLQAAPAFGERGQALIQTAQGSFVDGLTWAAVAAVGLLIVTSAIVLLRGPRREHEAAPDAEPALEGSSG
jgi:DHA2 family integral membrane protein (MFS transporter)